MKILKNACTHTNGNKTLAQMLKTELSDFFWVKIIFYF